MNTNKEYEKPVTQAVSPEQRLKARITFIVILAIFLVPYFIAPMFFKPDEMDRVNKGTLIMPHVSFDTLGLFDEHGSAFLTGSISDHWTMMFIVPGDCDISCNNQMYTIRQVRKTLGRNMNRVQLLAVHLFIPAEETIQLINEEFGNFTWVNGDPVTVDQAFEGSFSGKASENAYIYLVSPDGKIFMYYPAVADEHESVLKAEDIRVDLNRTLKGSLI